MEHGRELGNLTYIVEGASYKNLNIVLDLKKEDILEGTTMKK